MRMPLAVIVTALVAAGAGVAWEATAAPHAHQAAQLTVYAAASLTDAFPKLDPREKYSFGGSNTLAAQIALGAPADVFASANTTLPAQLHSKGLCSRPVAFTRNRLVIVVSRANPANIHGIYDLTRKGVKLDIAGSGVPVGGYTLQVLKNMNLANAVLANVVSKETDVREVLAKVALGEADAGFVYSTDAKTASGKLIALKVPAWAQPKVQYGACIVSRSRNKAAAQAFIDKLVSKAGQATLISYGFLPRATPRR